MLKIVFFDDISREQNQNGKILSSFKDIHKKWLENLEIILFFST